MRLLNSAIRNTTVRNTKVLASPLEFHECLKGRAMTLYLTCTHLAWQSVYKVPLLNGISSSSNYGMPYS